MINSTNGDIMIECTQTYFKDRKDAANHLIDLLPKEKVKHEQWELVALSSGGLEIASVISEKMKLPVDFLFSEPIKAPQNKDCEIARVSESEEIVIHDAIVSAFEIQYDYIYGEASRKHEEKILSYIYKYRTGRHFKNMRDKCVLIVDEGSETGMVLMCAIKSILAMDPKALYIAVPVMPTDILELVEPLVDNIFCIQDIEDYIETSYYYDSLESVDEEKIRIILGEKNEV